MAKRQYYIKLFTNFRTNTKKLWSTVNSLTNTKKSMKQKSCSIVKNKKVISDPVEIADAFNNFFSNIGKDLDSKLPPSQTDALQYLTGVYNEPMNSPEPSINDVVKVMKSK